MISIFAILPGFFIAALAAVATFNREEIDYTMPEPAPKLVLRTGGSEGPVALTFRMFMSHMFAYLTALSFLSVFIFVAADLMAASVKYVIEGTVPADFAWIASAVMIAVYVAIVAWLGAKIVLTTLVGLYFLAERIHRLDS